MKKLLVLIFIIVIAGCGANEEEKLAAEVSELNAQASSHYDSGNLSSAIEVFEKSLIMKEEVDTRQKLTTIKEELQAVDEVKDLFDELRSLTLELQQQTRSDRVIEIGNRIEKIIADIPLISAPEDSDIKHYISNIPKDADYLTIQIRLTMFLLQAKGAIPFEAKSMSELVESLESFIDNNPLPEFYK
ncbi:hypothetical protein ABDI30_21715 [Paenibacillus cisolokensis]|uniref:hypothetical protein n=1 Tax=Paenibacillus cisolokensis TaxID=1658519 RepID=UPI003D2C7BDF